MLSEMESEGTDYSFVPSSLAERCFGFDATIVIIAVWTVVLGYDRNVHNYIVCIVRVNSRYVNAKRPPAESKINTYDRRVA